MRHDASALNNQTMASSALKTNVTKQTKKCKGTKKTKKPARILGQVECADQHDHNLDRFVNKMQSLRKYQGAEEHDRYMTAISIKKDMIQQEEFEKHGKPTIGLVGSCPKLKQQMWKSTNTLGD